MRRMMVAQVLGCLLLLGGAVASAQSPGPVWMTDFEKARALAAQSGKPLLVHFYAEWCGPCMQIEQKVLNQPAARNEIEQRVVAVKLDVDHNAKLSKRFGVEKLPTDIIVEPTGAGAQLLEAQGFHPVEEYRQEIIVRGANRYSELLAKRKTEEAKSLAKAKDGGGKASEAIAEVKLENRLMLDGYCPVTLWKNRRWVKGNTELKVEHRGQHYFLADEVAMKEFKDNPERYAPRFMGCDPTMVYDQERAIKGDTRFAAFYDEELYMFTSEDNRKKFKASPDRYTRTRVVFEVNDIEVVTR